MTELPPPCPTCGAPAETVTVNRVTVQRGGMAPVRMEPGTARGFRPTIECARGHFYVEADDGPVQVSGPPEDITIREGRL